MDLATRKAVQRMAEENEEANPVLAMVLFAFLGAVEDGAEAEFASMATDFAKKHLDRLKQTVD